MSSTCTAAPTIGEICKRFGVQMHQAKWVIAKLRIEPTARAGNLRIFSDADVERIGQELARIAASKRGA